MSESPVIIKDKTVVFADMVKSTSSGFSHVNEILKRTGISPKDEGAVFTDTWGDAFLAAFESSYQAVRFALGVRDKLCYFDWRAEGFARPPLLRIAIAVGSASWQHDPLQDRNAMIGRVFAEVARIEPISRPGAVFVADTVRNIVSTTSDEFHFHDHGELELPKGFGSRHLFVAYWAEEQQPVEDGRLGPLLDDQYYRREESLRRFAFLWLYLDQLPIGSWGRSVSLWMKEVWRGIPELTPSPLMEVEGGFETTILNLELLETLLGENAVLQDIGLRAFDYLEKRHVPGGFGTISYSRHGSGVEPHPRHTAITCWLLGKRYTKLSSTVKWRKILKDAILTHLYGDSDRIWETFKKDRNPLLLYMATWSVAAIIRNCQVPELLAPEESGQILTNWSFIEPKLRDLAMSHDYEGKPQHLAPGRRLVFPLTVPYGSFIRMESYSILSAALFVDPQMPQEILDRLRDGIKYIINDYKRYCKAGKRYSQDPLQPSLRGPRTHFACESENEQYPDIGITSMLVRILRDNNIVNALWRDRQFRDLPKIRCYLQEDLVELFDRYLLWPKMYDFTHPGMLAGIIVGDHKQLKDRIMSYFRNIVKQRPPVDLRDNNLDDVLSERKIVDLVEALISADGSRPKIQLASFSISRLLLDKLRPGRFIHEQLNAGGIRMIAERTLGAYMDPSFAERFSNTWGDKAIPTISGPFLTFLDKPSKILDVGCGPGQYALEFATAGHTVELLDGSPAFLQIAEEKFKKRNQKVPDYFQCNVLDRNARGIVFRSRPYDAIWCSGLFVHCPTKGQADLLQWFHDLLGPGGFLFVNIILNNPRLFAWDGRYYTYILTSEEFENVLAESGFDIELTLLNTSHRNTYQEPILTTSWVNYYARKRIERSLEDVGEKASLLTALAYQRSVNDFVQIHRGTTDDERQRRVDRIKDVLDKLEHHLARKKEVRVLDVGCGPGDFVIQMAMRGWIAVGLDISDQMIHYARDACSRECPRNCQQNATFVVGDVSELPKSWEGQFDGVLCVTIMQHIPLDNDYAFQILREIRDVLKPGGVIRFDVQLGRESGFDPDLRYIQSYADIESVQTRLRFNKLGFEVIESPTQFKLPLGINTFRRPIEFRFVEFWLRKMK